MTSISVYLVTANFTAVTLFGTSIIDYNSCLTAAISNCLYFDSTNLQIYWGFYDEMYVGVNTIYIVPNFYGADGFGFENLLNYTDYNQATNF
jgi:hypothetical protein